MKDDSSKSRWWEREYYEMLAARKEREGDAMPRIISRDWPKPKLSDVLRCAHMAKEQPEIWELAQEEALIRLEDWDYNNNRMAHLMSSFHGWFRYKYGFEGYYPGAFGAVGAIIREWAKPDFDGDEVALARSILHPSEYIDDLQGKDSVQRGA